MKLYNTYFDREEPFEPRGKKVSIYVCGITPYDTTHLGHAFTYASVDVLIRYLEWRGLKVTYVQNVTDIDDDILRKAKQVDEDWRALGDRWTNHFIRDMQALNIRPPDHYPRATDVIEEIIDSIQDLMKEGVAYQAGGSVYYSVEAWGKFGMLSHLPKDDMLPIANERGNRPSDPNKRDPLDFVLWQAMAPGEPYWESPWGPGRPGWHIECSTMSTKYLGEQVDIHGGGADLCFPHHECEIAQVEPVTEKPFVRVWFHTAMVRYQGEKMSKSLGNLIMISDLLETYPADAIRVYLASNCYRQEWSYDKKDLDKAEKRARAFLEAATAKSGNGPKLESEAFVAAFISDMNNDLDTPGALKILDDLADRIQEAALAGRDVSEAQEALRAFGSVFGLRFDQLAPDTEVLEGWAQHLRE